jgi:glutamate-1-semialdehyde 2,1-aminomutase
MLRRQFLASNCIYFSTEHSQNIIDSYFDNLDPIFKTIAECEAGRPIGDVLTGLVCHSGFKRLN